MSETAEHKSAEVSSLREYTTRRLVQLGDPELIARASSGEDAAFAVLMERYMPCVLGCLSGKTRNAADTEDIVQDVFLTAFRNLPRLRNPEHMGPWLLRVARSRLLDFYRAECRRPKTVALDSSQEWRGNPLGDGTRDPALSPVDRASEIQTRQLVLGEIARMREAYRLVLYMRLVGEESTEVIAQRLGITSTTVRQRLFPGVAQTAQSLEKAWVRGANARGDGDECGPGG